MERFGSVMSRDSACCSSLRVMVVDDFSPFADHVAEALRRNGYRVRVAYNGAEALRVAEEFEPNAVISDVHMPGLSGFELAEVFAERFPNCGVLLITMDSALMRWEYKGRAYKILHKASADEALLEFLAACETGNYRLHGAPAA